MPDERDQFERLMQRIRQGSDEAAGELLNLYGNHVYRAVRRRLNRRLRSRFDSQDFVQAVWVSFFANLSVVQKFNRPEALVAYLAQMASNKVIDECRRRLMTEKNNVNRERSLDDSVVGYRSALAHNDPTASEMAVAREQWSRLAKGHPSREMRILELRLDGATYQEIATKIGANERTIRRVIRRLSERLAR